MDIDELSSGALKAGRGAVTRGFSFAEEFLAFIKRGNVVDLAVGVIVGGAFGRVVSSLVGDVLMPPMGWAIGGVKFSELALRLGTGRDGKPVTLNYGNFLQACFDFLVIGLCVFLMVKVVNRLMRTPSPAPAVSDEVKLLTEIRDLLKDGRGGEPAQPSTVSPRG